MRLRGHTLRREADGAFLNDAWNVHSLDGDWWKPAPAARWLSAWSSVVSGTPEALHVHKGNLAAAVGGMIWYGSPSAAPTAIGTYASEVLFCSSGDFLLWSDGDSAIQAYDTANPGWGVFDIGLDPPSTAGVTATPTTGGSMAAGSYVYALVWQDAYGNRSKPSAFITVTVTAGNNAVAFSNLPASPHARYSKLLFFRTEVNGSSSGVNSTMYYTGEVAAGTATWTDQNADASLTETLRNTLEWPSTYRQKPEGRQPIRWGQRLCWFKEDKVWIGAISDYGLPREGEAWTWRQFPDEVKALGKFGDMLLVWTWRALYGIREDVGENGSTFIVRPIAEAGTVGPHTVAPGPAPAFWYNGRVYQVGAAGVVDISEEVSPLGSEADALSPTCLAYDDRGVLWVTMQIRNSGGLAVFLSGGFPYAYAAYVTANGEWYRFLNYDFVGMAFNPWDNVTYVLDTSGRVGALDWTDTGLQVADSDTLIETGYTFVAQDEVTLSVSNAPYPPGTWILFVPSTKGEMRLSRVAAQVSTNGIRAEGNVFEPTGTIYLGLTWLRRDWRVTPNRFRDTKTRRFNLYLDDGLSAGETYYDVGDGTAHNYTDMYTASRTMEGYEGFVERELARRFVGGRIFLHVLTKRSVKVLADGIEGRREGRG